MLHKQHDYPLPTRICAVDTMGSYSNATGQIRISPSRLIIPVVTNYTSRSTDLFYARVIAVCHVNQFRLERSQRLRGGIFRRILAQCRQLESRTCKDRA